MRAILSLLAILCLGVAVPVQGVAPHVGEPGPPLDAPDVSGEEVVWPGEGDRAVVLYFHGARTEYGAKALDQFVRTCLDDPAFVQRSMVVLLVDDPEHLDAVRSQLDGAVDRVRIVVAESRAVFRRYHVISYPTVYVLSGTGVVVDTVKGYGPMLAYRVGLATRLATGAIDRPAFEHLLSDGTADDSRALDRSIQLARKLCEQGRPALAERALRSTLDALEDPPDCLVLYLAHLLLLQGRGEEAAALLAGSPGAAAPADLHRLLEARIAASNGDTEGARTLLESSQESSLERAYVRGLVLESEGRWREAAEAYRQALDSRVFVPQ